MSPALTTLQHVAAPIFAKVMDLAENAKSLEEYDLPSRMRATLRDLMEQIEEATKEGIL